MRLEIKDLVFKVPNEKLPILSVDEFSLGDGESLVIRGESGSGKSTFLNLISGLEEPTSGEICWIDGEKRTNIVQLNATKKDEFRAKNFGIIMQNFHLSPNLTALENVMIVNLFVKNSPVKEEKAVEILKSLGIESFDKQTKFHSRGQMQRIAIARALSMDPKVLICDEPTASLDSENSNLLAEIFLEISKTKPLIISTHDSLIYSKFENILAIEKNKELRWVA